MSDAERIHELEESLQEEGILLQQAREMARELLRLHWRKERPTSAELADLETGCYWLTEDEPSTPDP